MQDRTGLAMDNVCGSIAALEQIIRALGPSEFERRPTLR